MPARAARVRIIGALLWPRAMFAERHVPSHTRGPMTNLDTRSAAPDRLRLEALVVIALGAAVLDVLVTFYALTHHWGSELNPLAMHTIAALGLRGTAALNLAVRLG